MNKRGVGDDLDRLTEDVKRVALDFVIRYRKFGSVDALKIAIDTPQRARAQIAAWIADYNAANGAGAGQAFLASCLTAAGSSETLSTIDAALSALEAQARTIVTRVKADGWTWDQAAAAVESAIVRSKLAAISYTTLPVPAGYVTVWGETWK